jgi:hypothetical protein
MHMIIQFGHTHTIFADPIHDVYHFLEQGTVCPMGERQDVMLTVSCESCCNKSSLITHIVGHMPCYA